MNILVFCSAQNVPEKYGKDASELAARIAKAGHTLIWGGSNIGTMKMIADAAQAAGGKIVGVSMELLAHKARKDADEMITAKDLSERKKIMLGRADAIVVLAGGIGTLDEATDALAHKRLRSHDKQVIFLDTDGFYEGFKMQWERMEADGFLSKSKESHMVTEGKLVHFAATPEEVMQYLA